MYNEEMEQHKSSDMNYRSENQGSGLADLVADLWGPASLGIRAMQQVAKSAVDHEVVRPSMPTLPHQTTVTGHDWNSLPVRIKDGGVRQSDVSLVTPASPHTGRSGDDGSVFVLPNQSLRKLERVDGSVDVKKFFDALREYQIRRDADGLIASGSKLDRLPSKQEIEGMIKQLQPTDSLRRVQIRKELEDLLKIDQPKDKLERLPSAKEIDGMKKQLQEEGKLERLPSPKEIENMMKQLQPKREPIEHAPESSLTKRLFAAAVTNQIIEGRNLDVFSRETHLNTWTPEQIREINACLAKSGSDLRLDASFHSNPSYTDTEGNPSKTLQRLRLIDQKTGKTVQAKGFSVPL